MLEDKIRDVFADMVVLKDPQRSEYFSNLSIPSYMRDWLVMKFSDENGIIDYDSVRRYIKRYIPSREDFEQYKFQMVNGESVQFLARVRVSVDVKNGKTVFELPDFGGARGGASGVVAFDVAEEWQETLLRESENWGIITLCWTMEGTPNKPKGVITMVGYKPFCPYSVDLDFYREARREFNIHEWIDVIISAVDYNPDGYLDEEGNVSEETKLFFLRRLLPFMEKRVNLIELAPKGTGKSYVFEKISKRGWLISGGTVTAQGGEAAAGIGSGAVISNCGTITIKGGTVTGYGSKGDTRGAGIGSGNSTDVGDILISGGTITATSNSKFCSAIGCGGSGKCSSVTIKKTITSVTVNGSIGDYGSASCGPVTIEEGANVIQK